MAMPLCCAVRSPRPPRSRKMPVYRQPPPRSGLHDGVDPLRSAYLDFGFSGAPAVKVALRTAKWSSHENTRWRVLPSALIHLVGKLAVSPGPTSHFSVKYAVVHGPHGSGAS